MRAILNGPMSAGHGKETLGGEGRAQQRIAALCGGFPLFFTCRNDLADRLQTGPVMASIQPIQVMTQQSPAPASFMLTTFEVSLLSQDMLGFFITHWPVLLDYASDMLDNSTDTEDVARRWLGSICSACPVWTLSSSLDTVNP